MPPEAIRGPSKVLTFFFSDFERVGIYLIIAHSYPCQPSMYTVCIGVTSEGFIIDQHS